MGRVGSFTPRGRSFTRAPRRQSSWTAGPGGGTGAEHTIGASSSSTSLWSTGLIPLEEGLTIVRIRGELLAFLTAATAALDGFVCGFGITLVSDEAFAAGAASIPSPIDDIDYDEWMYYTTFSLKASAIIAGGAAEDHDSMLAVTAAKRIEIDNKAMRKFPVGKTMVALLEVQEIGTAVVSADLDIRTLVKLS